MTRIVAHHVRWLSCCLIIAATLVLGAGHARADFLGLAPGAYDITLTCVFTNCGGPFTGRVTIVGADATDWLFHTAFDGVALTFSGDPSETTLPPPNQLQVLAGPDASTANELDLFHETNRASGDWHIFAGGVSIWHGGWVATAAPNSVPEPASLVMLITALVAIGTRSRLGRT